MLQLQYKNSNAGALWLVDAQYTLGSDKKKDIFISAEGVEPQHATLHVNGDDVSLINNAGQGVWVNGKMVNNGHASIALSPSDVISISGVDLQLVDLKSLPKRNAASPREEFETWLLRPLSPNYRINTYKIDKNMFLGRSRECDISIPVPQLSRRHAEFMQTKEGLKLTDLNSSNGTFVNGKAIRSVLLKDGDKVTFDNISFTVSKEESGDDKTFIRAHVSQPVNPIEKPRKSKKSPPKNEVRHQRIKENSEKVLAMLQSDNGQSVKVERHDGMWRFMLVVIVIVGAIGIASLGQGYLF